ncbi:hypothetical protein P12x_002890 [Tundrisphaera lichenicola]|uniref:hypothetical protein n=1 Tax=Tundrisphaera lichenicola TaxID=2029860 RepID=UPI003EBC61B1
MCREDKQRVVGITVAVVLVGVAIMGYVAFRTYQRQEAVRLLVGDRPEQTLEMMEASLPSVSEEVQRLVYERALIVAGNIQGFQAEGSSDSTGRSLVPDAIHRIALGNDIQDQDVIAIVRWGWANNW